MPPLKRSPSSRRLQHQRSTTSTDSFSQNVRKSAKQRTPLPPSTPLGDSMSSGLLNLQSSHGSSLHELEQELVKQLAHALGDCSRQRLRSLQMSLRSTGSGEARIPAKELWQILLESQMKLNSRTFQLVLDLYEDSYGINYERMWNSLVKAQGQSGRDSVLANDKNNQEDLEGGQSFITQEEWEAELVRRIEDQLLRYDEPFDLDEVKQELQIKDVDKAGRIKKEEVEEILRQCEVPLYGALQTAIIARCDDENKGLISWPELIGFLERASQSLVVKGQFTKESIMKLKMLRKQAKQDAQNKARLKMLREANLKQVGGEHRETKDNGDKAQILTRQPSAVMTDPVSKEIVKKAFNKALQDTNGGTEVESPETAKIKSSLKEKPGFLKSMRSLLSGKKRSDNLEAGSPLLQEDSLSSGQTSASQTPNVSRPTSTATPSNKEKSNGSTPVPSTTGPKPVLSPKTLATPSSPSSPLPSPRTPNERPRSASHTKGNSHTSPTDNSITNADGRMTVELQGNKLEFYPPEGFKPDSVSTDPPQERLQLDWVYGYRGHDTRSNLFIVSTDEIVYFIGCVVILYDKEQHKQRHYREHTHEIRSLAVHPNKVTVASGQSASSQEEENIFAHVRLWRCDTLQTMHIIGVKIFYRTVTCLAFSATQNKLCAVDDSPDHVLSVWDVSLGKFLAKASLGIDYTCDVDFQPRDPSLIVVIGRGHQAWWKVYPEQGTIELYRKPEYQTYLKARFVTCLWHSSRDDLITGDSNGTVYVWAHGGNIITNLIKHAHDGPVLCVTVTRGHILTGGRDSVISAWLWNKNMDKMGQLEIPKSEGGVRMLTLHKGLLLIGTTTNSILTASLSPSALRNPLQGVTLNTAMLTQGHYGDIGGFCIPPNPDGVQVMLTSAQDGYLCAFDTTNRKPLWKCPIQGMKVLCSDCSHTGTTLVLATKDHSVHMLFIAKDEEGVLEIEEVFQLKLLLADKNCHFTMIKLAPDCSRIAVGDSGGTVYMVGLRQSDDSDDEMVWDHLYSAKCHSGSITGLDWSVDQLDEKYFIRTSSSTLQCGLWDSVTLCPVKSLKEVQNVKWASVSCKLAYCTIGVWFSKQAQESKVTAIDVNPQQTLVAMGDSHGYISLFKYPCSKKGAYSHTYRAHRTLTHIRFCHLLNICLSIGRDDHSILQWKVV